MRLVHRFLFKSFILSCLVVFSQCFSRDNNPETEAREVGMINPSESGIITGDAASVSTIKRGMVVARKPEKKLKGPEGDKNVIYRFHPFEHEEMQLRLTTAGTNDGKNVLEDNEIDLAPWANKMIEVQGSSFSRRWVYNAKINGIVVPDGDTLRALTGQSSKPDAAQQQQPAGQ